MSQLGIAAYEAMHGVGGWGEIGPAGRAAWDRVGEAVRAAAEAEICAAERERCARVAELYDPSDAVIDIPDEIAAAIRGLGAKP